ncbi:MAG: VCBS repeat-containing protein, partial [Bacteroidota bacterium]|nr:VCBS repeat-containing protein [Bacteroidota bacterium]
KLFRNDNGHFIDITKSAGIKSNRLTFSLGVSVADINKDGWPDIYISNDFKEPDYLYINNHDGTFTDSLKYKIKNTSLYGMGIDINDYNNDLLPDIIQLDMMPEDNHAQKMHIGADNFDQYNMLFKNGMLPQFMRNTLQKNNGDGTFSEVGQLAGISNTDWSWSPLLADFDNDGFKDLFISNGYKRDNTNLQFIKYSYDESKRLQEGKPFNLAEYISNMQGINLPNYIYRNNGKEQFENKVTEWGMDEKSFSNGAIYADLDNDGDLDLITNNIDSDAGFYKNNTSDKKLNHFLRIQLKGDKQNSLAYGTKIILYANGQTQYQEQLPVRGYQSSVDPVIHFGVGNATTIDSLIIIWPNDHKQVLQQIKADQTITAFINQATATENYLSKNNNSFFKEIKSPINFKHNENDINDFAVQPLLPHYFSRSGPCMAKADVNGDGMEDVFIGGAKGQPASLWLQTKYGFTEKKCVDFIADKESEDVSAIFFDADNDGDMDLLVSGGGYEFSSNDQALQSRLYINDGKGNFTRSKNALPPIFVSAGVVKAIDFDKDGNTDLFIGGKVVPGAFPTLPRSYLLKNIGKGIFEDVSGSIGKNISKIGMISDALWLDVNGDGYPDLITAGEWNSIKVFINKKNYFEDASKQYIPFASKGWWNCLQMADMDGDGDMDVIAGNQGWNNQFHASVSEPMDFYAKDFDKNGYIDPIFC